MSSENRLEFENKLWSQGFNRVMGLDEVGRGCLAGPVVAAGVIFSPNTNLPELRDSKKLREADRIILAERIKSEAKFWTIKSCDVDEIDDLNILWASIKAMNKCVESEGASADYLLIDGNKFKGSLIPHTCVVKGDDRSQSIAAASIIAKVFRDELMRKLSEEFPFYAWEKNVGYPTRAHKSGIIENGITIHHRKSFKLGI